MLIKQLSQFKLMRNKKFAIKKKKRKKLGEVFSKKVRKLQNLMRMFKPSKKEVMNSYQYQEDHKMQDDTKDNADPYHLLRIQSNNFLFFSREYDSTPLFEPTSIKSAGSALGGLTITRAGKRQITCIAKSHKVTLLTLSKRSFHKINQLFLFQISEKVFFKCVFVIVKRLIY